LNARASILASALPKNTYYQPTQPIHKNTDLTPPIISRFDLMFVMQEEELGQTLTTLDLQRYIRLARTFKPKVSAEAKDRLVRCYKKLREDRTYVRGACGVTVRQLESLIRLAEAISRVHLDDKVKVEYVNEAFELQLNTLKRAERENIDLGADLAEERASAPPEGDDRGAGAEAEPANAADAARRPKRMKITFAEYQRIGQMLTRHLASQETEGMEVKEEDLCAWYLEQIEDEIQTEAQMIEQQTLVQKIVERLIEKDRVIIVYRASEDPMRPEGRVLVKHPNFPVGEVIMEPSTKSK